MPMSHRHPHNILNTLQQLINYIVQPTRPSSQLDATTQPPVQPVQPTTLTTPAQPATLQAQLAQLDQTTEAYQTTLPTSTKIENQRTSMPKQNCHSAQKSQLYSMSPAKRSKRTRNSSTDNEHYLYHITSVRTKIEKP